MLTEEQLYNKIGYWVRNYHKGRFSKERLLGDFQHDLYLRLRNRIDTLSDGIIKKAVYYHPFNPDGNIYSRKTDWVKREKVMPDYYDPVSHDYQVYEEKVLDTPIGGTYKVNYTNGSYRNYNSITDVAKYEGVSRSAIYYFLRNGLTGRYTNRKLSHIKSIEKMELSASPFAGNRLPVKLRVTRNDYENHKQDKYADYVYDTDRWSDFNEYYLQLTHVTENYGLLVVEGKRLDI